MKRLNCFRKLIYGNAGFSFIEIAIALIIIGMLSGAGLLLFGKITDSTQRKETVQRLLETKSALLLFAEHQGKLPIVAGYHQKLGSSPIDSWQNAVSYKVSQNVSQEVGTLTQYNVCKRLKNPNGYTGWTPASWIVLNDQIEGTNYVATGTGGKAIVALLLSGGARDADGAGNFFDGGNAGTAYERKIPSETFDDLVVAITASELYGAIKEKFCMAMVTVIDSRTSGDLYYVYNRTTFKDIGSGNWAETINVRVPFDDVLEIHSAANAGDAPLKSATITADTTITLP